MSDMDSLILKTVIKYTDEAAEIIEANNLTLDSFLASVVYRNALSMSVFQATEYANKLSKTLKNKHDQVDWQAMSGMRNRIAHGYDGVDFEYIWTAATEYLPELKTYCEQILSS